MLPAVSLEQRAIDFYFDFVCPYAYLAATRIEALAAGAGATLVYKPMLLGGLFRAIGAPDTPWMSPAKALHNDLDMRRWARKLRVPLELPEGHPRRTVLALRAAIASGDLRRATPALFAAAFQDRRDLSDPTVVADALDRAGLDGAGSVTRASSDDVKAALRRNTDDAVRVGVFGAPSFVTHRGASSELLWGQDRLDFVLHALTREPWITPAPSAKAPTGKKLLFHFDYASPFAYLASTQVRALASRTGAELVYRPLLLGGLFRTLGTPNVPLFAMPEAKRAYMGTELARWAERWRVPFAFSSRFPLQTVRMLRVTLAAPDERKADLVDSFFRGVWVEDLDPSDDAALARAIERAGCDAAALLAAAQGEAAKEALFAANRDAEARGVFGVPTCIVLHRDEAVSELFWGQDRLGLVEEALEAE
jgi:2-hydroxychromene-2-carboxylate isomerase